MDTPQAPTRRGFLRGLIYGAAAAVAAPYVPVKTYSSIGSILRPSKPDLAVTIYEYNTLNHLVQKEQAAFVWQLSRERYEMILDVLDRPDKVTRRVVQWPDTEQPWYLQIRDASKKNKFELPPLRERV